MFVPQLTNYQEPINDCLCVFTGALEAVLSLQTHADNFYYGSHDGPIRSFNLKTGKRTQVLRGHTSWVNMIRRSCPNPSDPNSLILYSCSRDGDIKSWNVEDASCIRTFQGHMCPVSCLDVTADNKILASGAHDGNVILWNTSVSAIKTAIH